jgi:hypothetical protein
MEHKIMIMKKVILLSIALFITSLLAAQIQDVYLGAAPNDGTGDNLRNAFGKTNDNDNYLDGRVDTLHVSKTQRVSSGSIYITIQSAVTAASDYDIIKVYPGDYSEEVDISKSITLIGNGEVTLYSFAILGGDTVRIENFKTLANPSSDTSLHINTTGYVHLEDVELINSTNANRVLIVDDGAVYGSLNIRNNNGVDKVMFYGGESHLHGDYIYTVSPDVVNGAKVYLDYDRLGCVFEIEDSAFVQINAGMIRGFVASDYTDTLESINFQVRDTAKLILQCNNFNVGIVSYTDNEVSVTNSYGDAGKIYLSQNGTGKFYASNNTFIYRNDNVASHIVESAVSNTGDFFCANNLMIWRPNDEGYVGWGNPLYWVGGNYHGYNNTWVDYGDDSTSSAYNQIASFAGTFTADIQGSHFIYKGAYSLQDGFAITADASDFSMKLSDISFDVPNFGIQHGGTDWTAADELYLYDVKLMNENSILLEQTNGTANAIATNAAGQMFLNPSIFGSNIKYSGLGVESNSVGKQSLLTWKSDTIQMAKDGDALDSVIVTLTINNIYPTSMSSGDFKIFITKYGTINYYGIYNVRYNACAIGTGNYVDLDVELVTSVNQSTDWIAPVIGDIKQVSGNSTTTYKFAIVNKSLTYDSMIQLQAFNCIGIHNITIEAE